MPAGMHMLHQYAQSCYCNRTTHIKPHRGKVDQVTAVVQLLLHGHASRLHYFAPRVMVANHIHDLQSAFMRKGQHCNFKWTCTFCPGLASVYHKWAADHALQQLTTLGCTPYMIMRMLRPLKFESEGENRPIHDAPKPFGMHGPAAQAEVMGASHQRNKGTQTQHSW